MVKRVILITDTQERTLITESILVKADCVISARLSHDDDWYRNVGESDAVFFALEKSSPEILNGIRRLCYKDPKPVVMFVDKGDESAVEDAIAAGVSAYVVDGFGGQRTLRIRAILSAAVARFNAMQSLQFELDKVKARLREYKINESSEVPDNIQPGYIQDNIH
jgi:response regulator NasT